MISTENQNLQTAFRMIFCSSDFITVCMCPLHKPIFLLYHIFRRQHSYDKNKLVKKKDYWFKLCVFQLSCFESKS